MKNKKSYICGGTLALFAIVYTSICFTFPADNDHTASYVSTACKLVESSFTKVKIYNDLTKEEAGIKLLPSATVYADSKIKSDSDEPDSSKGTESIPLVSSINESVSDTVAWNLILPQQIPLAETFTMPQAQDPLHLFGYSSDSAQQTNSSIASPLVTSDSSVAVQAEESKDKNSTQKNSKKKTSKSKKSNKKNKNSKKKDKKKATKKIVKKAPKKKTLIAKVSISDNMCKSEAIGISVAKPYVNIRKKADTTSTIVGKLYRNSACEIKKTKGKWYKISSGTVTGYIKSEYIKTNLSDKEMNHYGTLTATVKTDGLNVRKKTDVKSKRVDVIYSKENYPVLKHGNTWTKLNIKDDKVKGYVKTEYVTFTMSFKEAVSVAEERARAKAKASHAGGSMAGRSSESAMNVNSDQVKLLACLIQAEAGNQCYEGKLAVANVVLNRIRSSRYPNNMHSVIYQGGQFTVASSGSLAKQLAQYSHFTSSSQRLSIQAAKDALSGRNNIGSALYFNRYTTSLARSKGGRKIQDHVFW